MAKTVFHHCSADIILGLFHNVQGLQDRDIKCSLGTQYLCTPGSVAQQPSCRDAWRLFMMPWSQGWRMLVVFGGKNTSLTAFKLSMSGCAGQLSSIMAIGPSLQQVLFVQLSQPGDKQVTCHPGFLVCSIIHWQTFNVVETTSLAVLPMTNRGSFSLPLMLAATSTVSRSLAFFPPVQMAPLKSKVLSGRHLKKMPVSSALKIL